MRNLFIFAFLLAFAHGFAQENERPWSASIMIGHHRIINGINIDGNTTGLLVPSWSFGLNRELNEKWFIGVHVDLIVQPYIVETGSNKNEPDEVNTIEREFPVTPAFIVGRRFGEYHSVIFGAGAEIESSESFAVLRLGYELAFPITDRVEALASLDFDYRLEGYNSYSLLAGVGFKL